MKKKPARKNAREKPAPSRPPSPMTAGSPGTPPRQSGWTPSTAAASESTLRHLVYSAAPPFAEQSSGGSSSTGPQWVIEWSQAAYHAVNNKATSGQLLRIMVAITSGPPDWIPGQSGTNKPINEPKNLVKTGHDYSTVYLLFAVLSQRRWQNPNATNVLFQSNHPIMRQIFRIDVNASNGALSITQIFAPGWSHESEGHDTGDGGAIAAQLEAYRSNSSVDNGRIVCKYQGSGGWSPIDIIVNDYARYYNPTAPQDLYQMYKTSSSTVPISDNQRNKDGSPPKIEFELRSKLK